MNNVIKFIMHGLASGRIKSTPLMLAALKELKHGGCESAPGNNPPGDPAASESEEQSQRKAGQRGWRRSEAGGQ